MTRYQFEQLLCIAALAALLVMIMSGVEGKVAARWLMVFLLGYLIGNEAPRS